MATRPGRWPVFAGVAVTVVVTGALLNALSQPPEATRVEMAADAPGAPASASLPAPATGTQGPGTAMTAVAGARPAVAVAPSRGSAVPAPTGAATAIGAGAPAPASLPSPPITARDARRHAVAVHFQRGVALLHAQRPDYAAVAFHEVLRLAPRMPEAHVNMGFALLDQERPAAARDFFTTAIELRPSQANAYYGLAVASEALGDMPVALGAMRSYVHLTPPEDPFVRKARAALWEWQAAAQRPGGEDDGDP